MREEVLSLGQAKADVRDNPSPPALVVEAFSRYPVTKTLKRGDQKKLVHAAAFSRHLGYPIDVLTTINAAHIQRIDLGGVFEIGHLWDGFRRLLELMRKWTTERGLPWISIWAREVASRRAEQQGEHWHIGHHLPAKYHDQLLEQMAEWTGEGIGSDTEGVGTVGRSVKNGWHIKKHVPGGQGPEGIAAYLGKAEPSRIDHYNKRIANPDRVGGRYIGEGRIEGKRMGNSNSLSPVKQRNAGFEGSRWVSS